MVNSSKEIENILLSDDRKELRKLSIFLEEDYENNLRLMFEVLLNKVSLGLTTEANTIIQNIERAVLVDYENNYKLITCIIKDTLYKISQLKEHKDFEYRIIKYNLLNIIRKVNEKKKERKHYNLYSLYYQLVFREKDLSLIEEVLKREKNILGRKDSKGHDILYNVLNYFANLSSDNVDEIKYTEDIIRLFFNYAEDILVRKKENYYNILSGDKEHVKRIREVLDSFKEIDIKALKLKYGISSHVHDDVAKELMTFKLSTEGRQFVKAPFITIDGDGATCLDDAIGMVKNNDGSYYYYVAICDIPSFIPYGTRTFYDAMQRIETHYLCDGSIDLYHPLISHDICSLFSGHNKNAVVYKYLVSPDYNIDLESMEIIKGIIRIQSNLTYDNVNKSFGITSDERKMIEDAYYLASNLKKQNPEKEKYRQIENLVYSDAFYHHSLFADKYMSANIIQESMILVNNSLARYFNLHNLVYIYRNHKMAVDKKIINEIDKLLKVKNSDYDEVNLQKIYSDIKSLYLNAYYDTVNKGHEGLGYSAYSHATSPARRFVDSFIEYLIYFQIFNKISDSDYYELEKVAREVVDYINLKKLENAKFESEYNYLRMKEKVLEKK